jgi:hypothetical protein
MITKSNKAANKTLIANTTLIFFILFLPGDWRRHPKNVNVAISEEREVVCAHSSRGKQPTSAVYSY